MFTIEEFFGARTRPVEPIAVLDGLTIARRPTTTVVYAHPPLDETPPRPAPPRGEPLHEVASEERVEPSIATTAPSLPNFDEMFGDDLNPNFGPDREEAVRRWLNRVREGQQDSSDALALPIAKGAR
jgi:hypothetical protein